MATTSAESHSTFEILKRAPEAEARAAVVESLQDYVGEQLPLLQAVEAAWQPSDFMPDSSKEDWAEQVAELRKTALELPDDILVTLVGDMITEEALPSYLTMLNRFENLSDRTGDCPSPWGRWSRWWTAEENRHGDLLNRFLYLCGRVNMRSVEVTIHHLLRNGFNAGMDQDAYKGFVYTSFQERATKISHANVAKLAKNAGNQLLNRICTTIAGDEARHEEGYKRFMGRVFEVDPSGAMLAFRDMMKKTIAMPARLMDDGEEGNIFKKFSDVAQRIGVYTAHDYSDILEHLVDRWKVAAVCGLKDEAARAQDYICGLAERYRKLAERMEGKMIRPAPVAFAWIFDRAV